MTSPIGESSEFAADWSQAGEMASEFVNQVLVQPGLPMSDGVPEGIYCTFGRAMPPLVFGPPDMVAEQVASYAGRLPIEPVGKIFLSRERLEELVNVLQDALNNLNAAQAASRAHNVG